MLDLVSSTKNLVAARSSLTGKTLRLEKPVVGLFLQGKEIKRYRITPSGKIVLIPYWVEQGKVTLISESEMVDHFPRLHAYLCENKRRLAGRERGKMKHTGWYGYVYPKNLELMSSPKILVPDIAERSSFALDEKGEFTFTSGYGITLRTDRKESIKYILGLLNSHLLDFHLKRVSTTLRGGYFRYFTQYIERLPIRPIDFSDKKDKARHDRMVSLVERMLDLHKRLPEAKTDHAKTLLQRQIEAADTEIDELVYDLYDLTPEEIRLIEEGS